VDNLACRACERGVLAGACGRLWGVIEELTLGTAPFRGSWAVQRGLLTERVLRGPRYRRLFPDIYLLADAPADLAARSRGALLLASGPCALSGYSAAELLGAGCAPAEANAELTVPGRDLREQPGLTVHRDLLASDEIIDPGGIPVTTALRTAWDLARWLPTVEAVVAMDALAQVGRFAPAAVLRIQERYPRARWRRRVPGVIDLSDPRAESPMETRSRLMLVLRGLPRPELQYKVYDEFGQFVLASTWRIHGASWRWSTTAGGTSPLGSRNPMPAGSISWTPVAGPCAVSPHQTSCAPPTPWQPRSAKPSPAARGGRRELDRTDAERHRKCRSCRVHGAPPAS